MQHVCDDRENVTKCRNSIRSRYNSSSSFLHDELRWALRKMATYIKTTNAFNLTECFSHENNESNMHCKTFLTLELFASLKSNKHRMWKRIYFKFLGAEKLRKTFFILVNLLLISMVKQIAQAVFRKIAI